MLVQTSANKLLEILLEYDEVLKLFKDTIPNLQNKNTQRIVGLLYLKISRKMKFIPQSNMLTVKLKSSGNGGYVLSFISQKVLKEKTTVLEFEKVDTMLSVYSLLPEIRSIYSFNNKYRIITKLSERDMLLFSEYCDKIYLTPYEIARTQEYGSLIMKIGW